MSSTNYNLCLILAVINIAAALSGFAAEEKISASDGDSLSTFAVSMSISGSDLFIGAPGSCADGGSQGAVYFYHFDSETFEWLESAKIEAVDDQPYDMLGRAVCLSGDLAIVSARSNCLLTPNSGVVYIFQKLFGAWQQMNRLTSNSPYASDDYGYAVAIGAKYAVVGAPLGGFGLAGKVYIYKRTAGGWQADGDVMAADSQMLDNFGFAVALLDSTIIIGAPRADISSINPKGGGTGAAYVFERIAGSWQQTQKITPSDATANNQFGCAVAMDNQRAVIGAGKDDVADFDTGSAYVYRKDATNSWTEEIKLTALDADSGDVFGSSVALSGKYLVVGAPGVDGLQKDTGAVYSYLLSLEGWTQKSKTSAGDAAKGDAFGVSVVVSNSATVVGAPFKSVGQNARQGVAYIYDNIQDLALPVQLSEFNAVQRNRDVFLTWRTESELNNLGFIIQRTSFGKEWATIASFQDSPDLLGRGTESSTADYLYIDKDVSNGSYSYRLADVNINGAATWHSPATVKVASGGVDLDALSVNRAVLYPAFPNPFNATTTVNFSLPRGELVDVAVYDTFGRKTRTLVADFMQAGMHRIQWDGKNDKGEMPASGVYFIQLHAGRHQQTQKAFLIR